MRIDQYLKIARLVKKRPVSKALAEQGRLFINDKQAKASSEVKVDDILAIHFGHRHLKVRILAIADNIKQAQSMILYEILEDTKQTIQIDKKPV